MDYFFGSVPVIVLSKGSMFAEFMSSFGSTSTNCALPAKAQNVINKEKNNFLVFIR